MQVTLWRIVFVYCEAALTLQCTAKNTNIQVSTKTVD